MKKRLLILAAFATVCLGTSAQGVWMPQATGFPQASVGIDYISAVNSNVLWAKGYDGSGSGAEIQMVTKTTNGGNLWTAYSIPGYSAYGTSMICALDALTAWVPLWGPSGGGTLVKTADGGSTWTTTVPATIFAAPDGFPNVVHFWNASEGMIMGDPNGGYFEIWTTTDGGANWTRTPQANIPAQLSGEWGVVGYCSVVGNTIWFGTNKSRVYKSTDKGLNWSVASVPFSNVPYVDVHMADALHGISQDKGSSSTGAICETTDGGATWSLVTTTGPIYSNSLGYVPGTPNTWVSTGAASGVSGVSYSMDGGHSWTDFEGTQGTQFLATAWTDPQNGWAGSFTDQTTPSTVGGMYKFVGNLVGLPELLQLQKGFMVYPNPSNGHFTCAVHGFSDKDVIVTVRDLVGKVVFSASVNHNTPAYNVPIDLSHLSKGIYVAECREGNSVYNQKVMVE